MDNNQSILILLFYYFVIHKKYSSIIIFNLKAIIARSSNLSSHFNWAIYLIWQYQAFNKVANMMTKELKIYKFAILYYQIYLISNLTKVFIVEM